MSLPSVIRGLVGSVKKLLLVMNPWPSPLLHLSSSWNSLPDDQILETEQLARQWNDLPDDIILKFALKLDLADFIRMGGVCRSWDAVINISEDARVMLQRNCVDSQMPWLLQEHSPSTDSIHLYSLSEGKRYGFRKPKFMWESFCCGTTNGWLIMVDGSKFDPLMFLWNPISARVVPLPPFSTIPCYIESLEEDVFSYLTVSDFIKRVQVFSVSGHLVVAAILGTPPFHGGCGQTLVLCTPEKEETKWTIIEGYSNLKWYYDILHHNGMLYVVQANQFEQGLEEECTRGTFEVSTISLANNCEVSLVFIHAKFYSTGNVFEDEHEEQRFRLNNADLDDLVTPVAGVRWWLHLAESSTFGELLLITRTCVLFGLYHGENNMNMRPIHSETRDFKVEIIKFDNDKSLFTLTRCTSLCSRALFVGSGGALCCYSELDQDCIWFLPSELYIWSYLQSKDSGIFCLRDKSIKRCFPSKKAPLPSNLGWFTPKLF